jgi:putative hydrolase of the HAD superfamily
LSAEVVKLLYGLQKDYSLYVVTDGNKLVQNNKIKSLDVERFMEKVYITYRYGLIASKPSLKCFEMIKSREKVNWEEIIYIGDNPKKDFVNLNKVNAVTIRVLQGEYSTIKVDKNYDAIYKIDKITELEKLLKNICK